MFYAFQQRNNTISIQERARIERLIHYDQYNRHKKRKLTRPPNQATEQDVSSTIRILLLALAFGLSEQIIQLRLERLDLRVLKFEILVETVTLAN